MCNSSAFQLLHPTVQETVLAMGWAQLHAIQRQTVPIVLQTKQDCIISAPTSGGKTEAAFLPILSAMAEEGGGPSIHTLVISPLKALINDQAKRLVALSSRSKVKVSAWHGDIGNHQKRALRRKPEGVLILTPESLESIFINHRQWLLPMFGGLKFIVIDELHAFLDSERGIHLQSLVARLIHAIGYRPRCVALSATISDFDYARSFINSTAPEEVEVVRDPYARRIDVILKALSNDSNEHSDILGRIAGELDVEFKDSSNLVFVNNRKTAEILADSLRALKLNGEGDGASFLLHHGSLSKEVRHHTETQLKNTVQTNAICTSSLELGIDIGNIETVAQIDPPCSVSSLMQRLGRSGRRNNNPSRLRLYIRQGAVGPEDPIDELLFPNLIRGIAMIRLALRGWLEPPTPPSYHTSTLIHQILSLLKEHGGVGAAALYDLTCRLGPFSKVNPTEFESLLRHLFSAKLVDQESSNLLILGLEGERVTSLPNFYASFLSRFELSVRLNGKAIGRMQPSSEIKIGKVFVLNGQRLRIENVSWKTKTIEVIPTTTQNAPIFQGQGGIIHTMIFKEMQTVLRTDGIPEWIDEEAVNLLCSARETSESAGLNKTELLIRETGIHWFPWVGTKAQTTIAMWAGEQKIEHERYRLSFWFPDASQTRFEQWLRPLAAGRVDPVSLAKCLRPKQYQKFDQYVPESLLDQSNAIDCLEIKVAQDAAISALAEL
jgi:ATP-dependent Lhr-like helicase